MKRQKSMGFAVMGLVVLFLSAVFVDPALAVRTSLTPATVKGPYPGTVSAGDLAITMENGDNTNGNVWTGNGRDLLLIQNPTGGAITVTFTSVADQLGRKGDITAYSIPAAGFMTFWFGNLVGWSQDAAGSIYVDMSATGLKMKVIRIP